MVFTSPVFLGLFLPVLLAVYFLANRSARSYVLLLFSILFYAWGEPQAVVVMIALMVGISFYVFQILSYLVDVYRREVDAQKNVLLNAGGYIAIGDCYRDTVGSFFDLAGICDWRKRVSWQPWSSYQKPDTYRNVAADLKMVLLCFQSFNTGRLDRRTEQFRGTFNGIKQAVLEARAKQAKKKEKNS